MLPGFIVSVCNNAVVPDPVPAPVSAAYRPVGLLLSLQTSPGPYPIGRLFSFQGALCKNSTSSSAETTGQKMAPLFKSFLCFSVFPSGLRIVPPITRKHYATAWHIAKLRSQDSCGFAGFTSIEFCGRNRRKPLMLQGFSNVPRNGTLRRDFFQAKNKYLSLICSEKPKCTPFFEKLFAAY